MDIKSENIKEIVLETDYEIFSKKVKIKDGEFI